MGKLVVPRVVAFDSSTWAMLSSQPQDEHVLRILDSLASGTHIPLVCVEHLLELAAVGNKAVVERRAQLLSQVPNLYTPASDRDSIGACHDITGHEFRFAANHGECLHKTVVARVRPTCFALMRNKQAQWLLRNEQLQRVAVEKAISNIAIASHLHIPVLSKKNLRKGLNVLQEEVDLKSWRVSLAALRSGFSAQLHEHGDRRLKDPDAVATEFYRETEEALHNAELTGKNKLIDLLECMGIDRDELPARINAEQCGEIIGWKLQAPVFARNAGLNPERVMAMGADVSPTLSLIRALEVTQKQAQRAEAGNLMDTRLASLTLYADITVVDKRTGEYLRQVSRRNRALGYLMKSFVVAPTPKALCECLRLS